MTANPPAPSDNPYTALLSLAVHEFRTPASVVGGYLRMLQRIADPPPTEQQLKMITEAEKSWARLVELVAELSDIGKIDAGSIPLARDRVDIFRLAQEVAEVMHESADRGVHLEVRGQAAGANTTGDSARLRSALQAIFRAILRETAGPATVVVDRRTVTEGPTRSAVVVIADAGRVENAYTAPRQVFDEQRGGMGLALPLARRILEKHGGAVWTPAFADNPAESRGSAILLIPISE